MYQEQENSHLEWPDRTNGNVDLGPDWPFNILPCIQTWLLALKENVYSKRKNSFVIFRGATTESSVGEPDLHPYPARITLRLILYNPWPGPLEALGKRHLSSLSPVFLRSSLPHSFWQIWSLSSVFHFLSDVTLRDQVPISSFHRQIPTKTMALNLAHSRKSWGNVQLSQSLPEPHPRPTGPKSSLQRALETSFHKPHHRDVCD